MEDCREGGGDGEDSKDGYLLQRPGSLEDSYIVGVLIGRGSYSMVHKCLHKGKSERACKVYKKAHLESSLVPEHTKKLLQLSHPNLISGHDVFETDKELQVIVDLATGQELLERIERSEHYSEREAAKVVQTILTVLQYLHNQGLAHGGVYPENLMYESEAPNAKLKLSEIAMPKKTQSPNSIAIYSVSVPNLDAQLSAFTSKCATDIWSLGILIYIMLCGSEPTLEELMAQGEGECEGEWSDISASARNLIRRLVRDSGSARLTAEEALHHPWVCGATVATRHMLDAQERLKTFNARRKLRATTHAIIATQRAMSIVKPFRNCQVIR